MPIFALQLKANLVGVTDLKPSDYSDFRWYLKLKCGTCNEEAKNWQYATPTETHTLTKGKGECHISWKCSFCSRTSTLEILQKSYASYNAENNEKFQTIVKFDCRGLEPIDFDPRVGWTCIGLDSGTIFSDIDLNEKEWADYDEKSSQAVEISEMSFQFVLTREIQ